MPRWREKRRDSRRDAGAPNRPTSLHMGRERLRGQRASSAPPTLGDGWQRWGVRSQLRPLPQRPLCRQHHSSGDRPALSTFNLSVLHPDAGAQDYTHSTDEEVRLRGADDLLKIVTARGRAGTAVQEREAPQGPAPFYTLLRGSIQPVTISVSSH